MLASTNPCGTATSQTGIADLHPGTQMKAGFFRIFPALILIFTLTALTPGQRLHAESGGDLVQLFHPFPAHFNSAISDDLSVASAASNVFVSLLKIGEDGSILPYLANAWEISEDRKIYTFHLQQDTVFHDGIPVTSLDVAFSFEVFRQYHPLGKRMFRRVEKAEALDGVTFTIHLSQPDPTLLFSLASPFMPILPQHVYGVSDILKNPANFKAVGSGPFMVADFRAGEGFILNRFMRFLKPDKPCLDRIIGNSGSDITAAIPALNSGSAHLFTFLQNWDIIDSLSENIEVQAISTGYESVGSLNYLEFNLRKKTLKDIQVRRAIAYAIDLDDINTEIYQDYTMALTGPLSLKSPFYSGDGDRYDLDLEKAAQLLDQAGYVRMENGIRFNTRLTWMPMQSGNQKKVATYIKTQLAKIGIMVELEPPGSYIDWYIRVAKWEHHMTLSRMFEWGDPLVNLHPLISSKHLRHRVGANTSGFRNEQADVLLDAAGNEPDSEIRAGLYRQLQTLVAEELPLYFMHETPYVTLISNRLQNFTTAGRAVIGPLDQVCLAEQRTTWEPEAIDSSP